MKGQHGLGKMWAIWNSSETITQAILAQFVPSEAIFLVISVRVISYILSCTIILLQQTNITGTAPSMDTQLSPTSAVFALPGGPGSSRLRSPGWPVGWCTSTCCRWGPSGAVQRWRVFWFQKKWWAKELLSEFLDHVIVITNHLVWVYTVKELPIISP